MSPRTRKTRRRASRPRPASAASRLAWVVRSLDDAAQVLGEPGERNALVPEEGAYGSGAIEGGEVALEDESVEHRQAAYDAITVNLFEVAHAHPPSLASDRGSSEPRARATTPDGCSQRLPSMSLLLTVNG